MKGFKTFSGGHRGCHNGLRAVLRRCKCHLFRSRDLFQSPQSTFDPFHWHISTPLLPLYLQSNLMHEIATDHFSFQVLPRRVGKPHEIAPSLLSRLFAGFSLCATEDGLFALCVALLPLVCLRSSSVNASLTHALV